MQRKQGLEKKISGVTLLLCNMTSKTVSYSEEGAMINKPGESSTEPHLVGSKNIPNSTTPGHNLGRGGYREV